MSRHYKILISEHEHQTDYIFFHVSLRRLTFLSRPNTRFGTTRTNISGSSMRFGNSMRCWHTFESPTFHYSLKTAIESEQKEKKIYYSSICSIVFSKHYFGMCLRFATNVNEITDSKMCNIQWCSCVSIAYYHLDLIF